VVVLTVFLGWTVETVVIAGVVATLAVAISCN